MLTQKQEDDIYNALLVGMNLDDAYLYAGLSPREIALVSEDDEKQAYWASLRRSHEYMLLDRLNTIQEKQARAGKEGAVTWALEHMYPQKYANKVQGEGRVVNIVLDGKKDPVDEDTVELHV